MVGKQILPKIPPTKLVASFILCLVLTSCSSADDSNFQADSVPEQSLATIGTHGELIYIQSDNVRAAGYDEVSMVMTVQFDRGAIYEYYGVPAELWTSFVAAQPHPWSQVGYPRLVEGAIPNKRFG